MGVGLWSCVAQPHCSKSAVTLTGFLQFRQWAVPSMSLHTVAHGDSCHEEAFTLLKYHHLLVYHKSKSIT